MSTPCREPSASITPAAAEKAALDYDPRIKNSEGGSFDASTSHRILVHSLGFLGEYRRSFCSLVSVPIVQSDNGAMQR